MFFGRKKAKTAKVRKFLADLHQYIVSDPSFRKKLKDHSELQIQTELNQIILRFLMDHFRESKNKNPRESAHEALYWGGGETKSQGNKPTIFGGRNYPDFIIKTPYSIAIEYKQGDSSLVKQGLGQALLHTVSGEYDFSMLLFYDTSSTKRIAKSIPGIAEQGILGKMVSDFNVFVKFFPLPEEIE